MEQLYEQLISRETLILAFTIVIGTFFIRRIVETAVPSCKDKDGDKLGSTYKTKFGLWWNSVILYAIPVVLGALIAIWAYTAGVLPGDFKSIPGAGMWGAVVGWCSSFLYKVARKFLKKKTGVDLTPGPADPTKPDSDPPPKKDEDEKDSEPPPKKKRQPTKKDEGKDDEDTKDEK